MIKKPWWLGPVLIAAAAIGSVLVVAGGAAGHAVGRYRGSRAELRRHARDEALKEKEREKLDKAERKPPEKTDAGTEGAA